VLHHCGVKYGISIPYNTRIGPGLYIGHHGGIVVNVQATIGADCNLNHGVTIGEKYGGHNPGVPIIGDRVYLGPGCIVIGGIVVGDDVAIGANSVVVKSVPSSGVMAGIPARLRSLRGSSDYVVNTNTNSAARRMRDAGDEKSVPVQPASMDPVGAGDDADMKRPIASHDES
jgi:serine O-acetyltransferase